MKKKPAASTQVRIDAGLSKEIDMLRDGFGVRTSRAAYVERLIRKGIQAERLGASYQETDTAESAFKK